MHEEMNDHQDRCIYVCVYVCKCGWETLTPGLPCHDSCRKPPLYFLTSHSGNLGGCTEGPRELVGVPVQQDLEVRRFPFTASITEVCTKSPGQCY